MNESSLTGDRRRFISGAGVLCAGLAANNSPAAMVAGSIISPIPSGQLDAAQFRACLNSHFQVQPLGRDLPATVVTLARVKLESFGTATPASADLAFSIDLAGGGEEFVQDTYAVTHPSLGEFVAMLVPSADRHTLTGIFHRFG